MLRVFLLDSVPSGHLKSVTNITVKDRCSEVTLVLINVMKGEKLRGAERLSPLLDTRKSPWSLRSPVLSHVSPLHCLFRGEVLVDRGCFALCISLQQPCSRGRSGPASSSPWTHLSLTFPKGSLDFPPALLCCVIHDGFGWVELRQVVSFTLGCVIKVG